MVQVDIFWSYAIGAGFGAAAAAMNSRAFGVPGGRADGDPHERTGDLLTDRHFSTTVLFLACVFAPSGSWLVWHFTGWETMHAVAAPQELPGWLVAAFALTNVTQGALGYLVARELWRRGHRYLAWLQMPLGYLAMFFVLVHGWDGTGYRRFFSPTPAAWRAGSWDPYAFLTSEVALTLYAMGLVLLPVMLWLQSGWWAQAHRRPFGRLRFTGLILLTAVGLGLGTAIVAAVLLELLGTVVGGLACAGLLLAVLHRRGLGGLLARAFPLDRAVVHAGRRTVV